MCSDGHIVCEVVVGGEAVEVSTRERMNDGEWRRVEWDANQRGMM